MTTDRQLFDPANDFLPRFVPILILPILAISLTLTEKGLDLGFHLGFDLGLMWFCVRFRGIAIRFMGDSKQGSPFFLCLGLGC